MKRATIGLPWTSLAIQGAGGARRSPATHVSSRGARSASDLIHLEDGTGVLATPRNRTRDDVWTDRMQRVVEARGHSEVAAAATKPPEEVAVLPLGSADHPAVGGDEIDRRDIVARPAEPPSEIAESASERQPRAAGVGHEPEHRGKAVQLRLAVHVAEETAGLSARHAPRPDRPRRRA